MGTLGIMNIVKKFNNTSLAELEKLGYLPLVLGRTRIGTVCPDVVPELQAYKDVFNVCSDKVYLRSELDSYEARSSALQKVLEDLRAKQTFRSLKGWRNECYDIRLKCSVPPFFKMERSGTPLFGVKQYGVHINGYVNTPGGGKSLWIQKRSKTKPTYPGKFDTFVGGGLADGQGVMESAVKEISEEAGLTLSSSHELRPCGAVSFLHLSERGVHPQTEFVFDLNLPPDFKPSNNDGEVDDFVLVTAHQLLDLVQTDNYKTTSIPIALDWLIRHGVLTVENECDIADVISELHLPLNKLYCEYE